MTVLRYKSYKITHGLAEGREKVVESKMALRKIVYKYLLVNPEGQSENSS